MFELDCNRFLQMFNNPDYDWSFMTVPQVTVLAPFGSCGR